MQFWTIKNILIFQVIRYFFLSILLCTSLQEVFSEQERTGVLCIDAISTGGSWEGNQTGAVKDSVFFIQVDSLTLVQISAEQAGYVKDLAIEQEHTVKISLNGKVLESFRFSFLKEKTDHVRLWYIPMYGTWSLSNVKPGHRCRK